MGTARVSRINVTPVKSLRLQHPDSVELVADGAAEDRRFLLVDDGRRLYNGKHRKGEHIRVFPISNWTELDVWQYIEREGIEIP